MRQVSIEVTVGVFMFMVLIALGLFTIILSRENIFTKQFSWDVRFPEVMGLREGDNVAVRGLQVGTVSRVWLESDGVYLRLTTRQRLVVREDYRVEIVTASVLGGHFVQIHEGSPEAPALAEGTLLEGERPVDLMDQATETLSGIRETLLDGGALDDIRTGLAELRTLAVNLNQGEGTIGKLLTDDAVYQEVLGASKNLNAIAASVRAGEGTLGKLLTDETAYDRILALTGKLDRGEGSLGRLLTDDTLIRDIEASAANLKEITGRLERGEGMLGRLLAEDDTLYDDLQKTVAALRSVSEGLRNGEGTLGRLIADDALYAEAQLLIREIRAAVDDIRETAPITTFSSIFFGAF
jgi:phospholipid/cholesterol/gamma-HCH transport system substrate-binding protein